MKNEPYTSRIRRHTPPSPTKKNCLFAFLIGGGICFAGQWLLYLYEALGATRDDASTLVTVTLIFLSALLTGIGVYDRIARVAGAGTLVPVTGFANAVVSPAIDTKQEGFILGVGAKIFTVAGPVILYGVLCGAVYGVLYSVILWFV
ncbi:MAG: stage V sporulation protein AC [Clostridia bacterium]|nr:stage V sporulation protein AC [Clostridia bacterium]